MLFKLLKKKMEGKVKTGKQIGDRFAISYGDLESSIYYEDEHPYYPTMIKRSNYDLDLGEYKDYYTVVEYIGDGQYLDLVSGLLFVDEVCEDDLLDTVTQSYQDKAEEKKKYLVDHPIGIRSFHELSTNIKQFIIDTTVPKKEEITSRLLANEENARKAVLGTYKRIDSKKMAQHFQEALDEDRKRQIALEARQREEERIRIEEERRLEEQRLKTEIDPKFDSLFPKILVKKNNKNNKNIF